MIIEGRGPGALRAAEVQSFGDHRIAMAAAVLSIAVAGAAAGPGCVHDVENVATSYPGFAGALAQLTSTDPEGA